MTTDGMKFPLAAFDSISCYPHLNFMLRIIIIIYFFTSMLLSSEMQLSGKYNSCPCCRQFQSSVTDSVALITKTATGTNGFHANKDVSVTREKKQIDGRRRL